MLSLRTAAIGIAIVAAAPLPAQQYAIVDVSVIPMTRDTLLAHQTVLIRDGRIVRIGPVSSVTVPREATRIEGANRFLIPGLGDAHAHLSVFGGGTALAARAVELFALHGITMARSMYTEPHHLDVAARIKSDSLLGPRLMIVSPALHGQTAPTPAAAVDSVARYAAAGYTVIKLLPGLSRETYDSIVGAARRHRVHVAGHVPTAVGLRGMLATAPQSLEHLDGFLEALVPTGTGRGGGFFGLGVAGLVDESGIAALVADVKKSGTVIVPTEYEMETFVIPDSGSRFAAHPSMRYAPAPLVAAWVQQKNNFVRGAGVTAAAAERYAQLRRRLIREMAAAGVPIAAGSDAFNQFAVPGEALFRELEIYIAAGLSPYATLRSATVEVARLMNDPALTGTLADGAVADAVLLDANPLLSIGNLRRQAGVLLRGRWLSADDIARRARALESPR